MKLAGSPRITAIIPARFAATRFPGKIIAPLAGKPLVLHAYERALKARLVEQALIATDDQRVVDALASYGVNVVMTRTDHQTGTDRIAEAAGPLEADIIVNVQGDEAMIDPHTIDAAIQPMLDDAEVMVSTARHRISDLEEINDPNVVKVICDQRGRALYFSRSAIPFIRDEADHSAAAGSYWQHVGLYVYRRDFLLKYSKMPQTPLERLEKLEQLRVLEHGYTIAVVDTGYKGIGVDSPQDLERVRSLIEATNT